MNNPDHDKTPVPESSQETQQGSKRGAGKLETPDPATETVDKVITPTSVKKMEKETEEIRSETGTSKP